MGLEPTMVVMSSSYPYERAAERTFIEPELAYLCAEFGRVILLPGYCGGARVPNPDGVEVMEEYGRGSIGTAGMMKTGLAALVSSLFWKELIRRPQTLGTPRGLARLIVTAGSARHLSTWLMRHIENGVIPGTRTILYSYWLGPATLAAGLVKDRYPSIRVVSRAHGADVYEHRKTPPYFPCRTEYIRRTDRIFSVSSAGAQHLSNRFPEYAERIHTARLGVKDPGVLNEPSRDGVFRIVSCSFTDPVKRLDLLADGVRCLAAAHPEQAMEWRHIGGGRNLVPLAARVSAAPDNLACRFSGSIAPGDVLDYYRENPVDVFINTSRSEGIPVSMMEARSFGIPVVAPRVGGLPEIITGEDGMLMGPNPTPEDIADTLWTVCEDRGGEDRRREMSRRMWSENFDEQKNLSAFARSVRALTGEGH